MSDSYYELLGVDPDASNEEIKTAYRETVKRVHPDRSDNADTKERFMRVQKARTVLLDPKKRARYDRQRTSNTEKQKQEQERERTRERDDRHSQDQDQSHGQQRQHDQQDQRQSRHNDDQNRRRPYQSWTANHQAQAETDDGPAHTHHPHERERVRSRPEYGTSSPRLSLAVVCGLAVTLFANVCHGIIIFLRMVRCPRARVDSDLLRSLALSPTGVRLGTTIALVFVLTIAVRFFGYTPHESSTLGLTLVLVGLIGSYTGYELLSSRTFYESRDRDQYKPDGRQRIWPIAVMNLLGIGLAVSALVGGAPTGGITFTGVLLLPFVVPLLFYSGVQPVRIDVRTPIATLRRLFTSVYRWLSVITAGVVVIVVFTRWGINTPELLGDWVGTSSPWFVNVTYGGIYAGLLLNFLVGLVMYACIFWSMYAMCRHLTAVPWTDRYVHGYRVRPGSWNLLVTGPFVVGVWMVLEGVPTIDVAFGFSTLTLTQQEFLTGLFVLPTVLTVLYILRRHIESVIHTRYLSHRKR